MATTGSSDKPIRLPLVISPENRGRSTSQDARLVNAFVESNRDGSHSPFKRPGMQTVQTYTGAGQGAYLWNGNQYLIFGGTVYKDGVALAGAVDTSNGVYRFNSVLGGTPRLFLMNGVKGYYYSVSDGAVTAITDINFPASSVKGSAYLDGTLYVMDASANIWGSKNLNDPTAWDALNLIKAQIEPDPGVALAKQAVYVIAFKQWTTEVFYDAANPTGSPLLPVQGAKVNWGCVSADSVQDIGGDLFWLGINKSSSPVVLQMTNLQPQVISTKAIERLLDDANFSTVYSWIHADSGHYFYVLTVPSLNLTLAYDVREQQWAQWTDYSQNCLNIVANTWTTGYSHWIQHATNGKMYQFEESIFNDDGQPIPMDIYTPIWDGGTMANKTMQELRFIADRVPDSMLYVRHSDDDYKTWSNFRPVNLNTKKPRLTNCGTFRRRAYHFRHYGNCALRMQAAEFDVELGTS